MLSEVAQTLEFIRTIDALKSVKRIIARDNGTSMEDSAQHSWHVAVMVMLLAPYYEEPIDIERAIKIALVHDIAEIRTGDVSTFNDVARIGKYEREATAMEELLAILPPTKAQEMRSLWDEYERRETPEAKFVKSVDAYQPLLQNVMSNGADWQREEITETMIMEKKTPHMQGPLFRSILEAASPIIQRYAHRIED